MDKQIRNVRVYWRLKGEGNRRYMIGQYHPNVQSIYVDMEQVDRACKRCKCELKDIVPFGNVAKVKVVVPQSEIGKRGLIARAL